MKNKSLHLLVALSTTAAFCASCNLSSGKNSIAQLAGGFSGNELEIFPAELSPADKEVATKTGFDPKALQIVKKLTGSQFDIIDLHNPQGWEPPRIYNGSWNDEDQQVQHLAKLAKQFPEFEHSLRPKITNLSQRKAEDAARNIEHKEELKLWARYAPYLRQAAEEAAKAKGEHYDPCIGFFDVPPKHKTIEELKNWLSKEFDGKPLKPEYQPVWALRFYIPVDKELRESSRDTSQTDPSWALFSEDDTPLIKTLQRDLIPLGYSAYSTEARRNVALFRKKEEAVEFLKSLRNPKEFGVISTSPSTSEIINYDPLKANEDAPKAMDDQTKANQSTKVPGQWVTETTVTETEFGTVTSRITQRAKTKSAKSEPSFGFFLGDIEKIGPNQYKSTKPIIYTVHTVLKTAVLRKVQTPAKGKALTKDQASDQKFQPLVSSATNGINYGIEPYMVVDKLKKWDEQYDLTILSASMDSVDVEFARLPDNLDELCMEMWLFCPDLIDADPKSNDPASKSVKEQFKASLKQTRRVTFWWD